MSTARLWTVSSSIPLGGVCPTPPRCRPPVMWPVVHAGKPLPAVNRMTDRCKNITLPQTSFAGGNEQWQALVTENPWVLLAQQTNVSVLQQGTVRYLWSIHTGQDRSQDCYRDEIKTGVPCGDVHTSSHWSKTGNPHPLFPTESVPFPVLVPSPFPCNVTKLILRSPILPRSQSPFRRWQVLLFVYVFQICIYVFSG